MMKTTDKETTALASIVASSSIRAGKSWGEVAIRRELAVLAHDLTPDEVLGTALAAIRDPDAKTPRAIGWDKYRVHTIETSPQYAPCAICAMPSPSACARAQSIVAPENRYQHDYTPATPRQRHIREAS